MPSSDGPPSDSTHSRNDLSQDPTPLTLDERRRAILAEIDNASFRWFHVKVSIVAGIGFFTNAYDIFTITVARYMIGFVYSDYLDKNGLQDLSPLDDLGVKTATFGGIIFGQLVFGWLADFMGRKKMYGIELIIMIVSTFAQALGGNGNTVNIIAVLIVWRVLMGIGIGGVYPLSAITVSEFSPTRLRGRLMTTVSIFQGLGTFAAALVAFILVAAYKNELDRDSASPELLRDHIDSMWRLLIGLGCIPAVVGLYYRFTTAETPRFVMDIDRNLEQAHVGPDASWNREEINYDSEVIRRVVVPKASWRDFTRYFSKGENLRVLIGVSSTWFTIDAIFYGLSLNQTDILGENPFHLGNCESAICSKLYHISGAYLIVAILTYIPGYWASFFFVDSWGRKPIQLTGFTIVGTILIILGATFNTLNNAGRSGQNTIISLYCLASCFQNFGPNMSTFVIPGELFPTRYRSTCYGIAAASGKLGAIIALIMFHYLVKNLNIVLIVFGCFMLTAAWSTLFLPETRCRSLEDLSNETQRGFVGGYTGRHERKH